MSKSHFLSSRPYRPRRPANSADSLFALFRLRPHFLGLSSSKEQVELLKTLGTFIELFVFLNYIRLLPRNADTAAIMSLAGTTVLYLHDYTAAQMTVYH